MYLTSNKNYCIKLMFATIFAACNRISGHPVVGGMIIFMCKYYAKIVVGAKHAQKMNFHVWENSQFLKCILRNICFNIFRWIKHQVNYCVN